MKILYITTIGGTMGFFKHIVQKMIKEGHAVDIACNEITSKVPECYREWGCNVFQISCTRSPINKGTLKAINEIKNIVVKNHYDVVHCHTPIAAMCTRFACRKLRNKGLKVFYTAHGFHFYKGAPKKNWLLYYPMEKLCSHWTDVLITINKEDFALAQKKMHAKRVEYVPGVGIDVEKFSNLVINRKDKREEIGVPEDAFLLLSVGELNKNKNHEVVIRAIAELKNEKVHYAIAGSGGLKDYLLNLAKSLGIENNIHLLGFRTDVAELYKASDVCVFPSIREGLGLAAIEGMASGLPLIISKNRGSDDFCENMKNGIVCQHSDKVAFKNAIDFMLNGGEDIKCMKIRNQLRSKDFGVEIIDLRMEEIYERGQ